MIWLKCARCTESFEVPESLAGRREKCPRCAWPILVPAPDEAIAGVVAELAEQEGSAPPAWSPDPPPIAPPAPGLDPAALALLTKIARDVGLMADYLRGVIVVSVILLLLGLLLAIGQLFAHAAH